MHDGEGEGRERERERERADRLSKKIDILSN